MLVGQKVEVRWNANNTNHFLAHGYLYTKHNDKFHANVNHLSKGSHSEVRVICDYCKRDYLTIYKNYIRGNSIIDKDSCKSCKHKKTKEVMLAKYGYENALKVDVFKLKQKNTLIERYGVENPSQITGMQDKIKKINLSKYGVESTNRLISVKKNKVDTYIRKYGVSNPMHHNAFKEKQVETNMKKYGVSTVLLLTSNIHRARQIFKEKYGVDNPMHVDEFRKKALQSMSEKGSIPTSRQQFYLHNLLGGQLNLVEHFVALDIAFETEKIYLEYNGSGHDLDVHFKKLTNKEFNLKEIKRYYYLKRKGWSQVIIQSGNDKLPSDEIIKELVEEAKIHLNKGHSWFEINIDESKVKCSVYEREINLGRLRRISKEVIERLNVSKLK